MWGDRMEVVGNFLHISGWVGCGLLFRGGFELLFGFANEVIPEFIELVSVIGSIGFSLPGWGLPSFCLSKRA